MIPGVLNDAKALHCIWMSETVPEGTSFFQFPAEKFDLDGKAAWVCAVKGVDPSGPT